MAAGPSELLPIFLKLAGRKVVLVGAGRVAGAKLPALLAAGARVSVIAPEISAAVERAPVALDRRHFVPSDLDGAWLVIAAATPEVNREVAAAAEERRIFVNAVDDPQSASAYAGGVVRRGGVTVAISTSGQAPALAGLLREALERLLPQELDRWIEMARELRTDWRRRGIPIAARRALLLDALNRAYARDRVAP
ncbi:MAG TPA: bifunctional precorrin-2 dehydrogenase/sirohydrochlorin ferrochelatase [Myxococcaceae bacterium]|nr:bifunctional precorrin-2 dehydrogenase/sirohydrochlorin ferrochelatase [Myxococcaceae bacterium]